MYRWHKGSLGVPRGCRGCLGVSGASGGVGMSGVYWRAGRDCRYSGARRL